jgi:hypothetical protein
VSQPSAEPSARRPVGNRGILRSSKSTDLLPSRELLSAISDLLVHKDILKASTEKCIQCTSAAAGKEDLLAEMYGR